MRRGFTLFELLIVLAVIAVFWGIGVTSMPRLLSGSGPDALARRLAGAGQEARQMAMLEQRPWELLLDPDQGVFYRAPLGAVARRELRSSGMAGDGSLSQADRAGALLSGSPAPLDDASGQTGEEDLTAARAEELRAQRSTNTLRDARAYDREAFAHDDGENGGIYESVIPEETRISRIWKKGVFVETAGRVSLVFGPRGFVQPAVVWVEDADAPGENAYTVYFQGLLPPVVAAGALLPDAGGLLAPPEEAGEAAR